MEYDHSIRKTTQYSRPIDFVPSTQKSLSLVSPSAAGASGDQVASLYNSIVSCSNTQDTQSNTNAHVPTTVKKEEGQQDDEEDEKIRCHDCELDVPIASLEQHLRGIAHRTSSSTTTPTEFLALNGSNVGFRLLKSQGWKYDQGLGPEGEGRRHPIATALKQDTLGLGHGESKRKRVTHRYEEVEEHYRNKKPEAKARPSGKVMARQARKDSQKRVAMLHYLNN
ncbi:hypothetical protein BDB00DRAFT_829376 [Zychaea mexicana]|uniref:uncharacterized protein n=1 Tax=Zychaea mexicana TaxID=64656 RepID=UPI0022FF335D|nr:uncharacterized protein BDB00DRAFT_829376 [Zychaea mexicana]KAI9492147.1 hypothetical protein BDB00DRAFT_829376 [Zychaea mexicana]